MTRPSEHALITQMLDALEMAQTETFHKRQEDAITAAREYLAATVEEPKETSMNRIMELADEYVMEILNADDDPGTEKPYKARAALQAEVAKQDEMLTLSGKVSRKLAEELEDHRQQLRKEQLYVQELADDARRYRWLRENGTGGSHRKVWVATQNGPVIAGHEFLDEAIDNAMKEDV